MCGGQSYDVDKRLVFGFGARFMREFLHTRGISQIQSLLSHCHDTYCTHGKSYV
jgi:hypothetical protein